MTDFSGLPLVIEAADLLPRLDSPQLILIDLSSANRYVSGHIPGARFVEGKRTQLGQPPRPACCRPWANWKNCSANSATVTMPCMWCMTMRAAAGPGASSGCST